LQHPDMIHRHQCCRNPRLGGRWPLFQNLRWESLVTAMTVKSETVMIANCAEPPTLAGQLHEVAFEVAGYGPVHQSLANFSPRLQYFTTAKLTGIVP
jgi:hypothetical protein